MGNYCKTCDEKFHPVEMEPDCDRCVARADLKALRDAAAALIAALPGCSYQCAERRPQTVRIGLDEYCDEDAALFKRKHPEVQPIDVQYAAPLRALQAVLSRNGWKDG